MRLVKHNRKISINDPINYDEGVLMMKIDGRDQFAIPLPLPSGFCSASCEESKGAWVTNEENKFCQYCGSKIQWFRERDEFPHPKKEIGSDINVLTKEEVGG